MMSPLVLKDVNFHNKVQMGSFWNGGSHCYCDLDKLKQDCIKCAIFWKDGYNLQRKTLGLNPVDDEAITQYISECFNQVGYAIPFTWHGGYLIFFYREGDSIYFASHPIQEEVVTAKEIKSKWWKKLFKN